MLTGPSIKVSQGATRRAPVVAPPFPVRYGYDAAGNQIARPGGVTVDYTPFDLPRKITQGGAETTFGYDGDQHRIRKTTPEEETLYFGDGYERVTETATGETAHRYHVRSPERVVAIVTRGGSSPGTRYVHADHLGSVDVVTEVDGTVVERRSYDAFGQRRNPEWGAPPPASFPMSIPLGFTGHESDHEFGLVNMRGRVFDPGLGRFLTTDPLIADVTSGQAFNPYSYVQNNPLTFVDPSGFQGEPSREPILPTEVRTWIDEDGTVNVEIKYPPRGAPPPGKGPREDSQVGVFAPPTDMDTTGSSGDAAVAAVEPEPRSWTQHRVPQLLGGFWGGVGLGLVPFAGTVEQALERGEVIDPMTPSMQEGFALGLIVGGVFTMVDGLSVGVGGVAATVTGVGAPVGVPTIAAAAVVATGGAANVVAGLQSLMAGPKGGAGPPAAGSATSDAQPAARGAPNPHGSRGGPAHREAIDRRIDELTEQGHTHVAGGSMPEEVIRTPAGLKTSRRADITTIAPDGSIYRENVGRSISGGSPVARERRALDDIQAATGKRPGYTPYDR